MRILLVEPFFSGSHRQWAEGYSRFSAHAVQLLTLPGRHWKWRMAAGAIPLAEQWMGADHPPADLVLATDMLDLPTFLALSRARSQKLPAALYFHENQVTYPWSPADEDPKLGRDHHYGLMHVKSALAADRLFFNSHFHRRSFLEALPGFLRKFPDFRYPNGLGDLAEKSEVLPLGLDLKALEAAPLKPSLLKTAPLLLWNHRWEYDKGPEAFFRLCYRLKEAGLAFRLVILGPSYGRVPTVFGEARDKLREEILFMGWVEAREAYHYWLQQADILPVTSRQDFFGASVVEAIYANTYPLLPDRLAYPEHIPPPYRHRHLYQNEAELFERTAQAIRSWTHWRGQTDFRGFVRHCDWRTLAEVYDQRFSNLTK